MELKECILTRRSVRRFDARPVPHEVLEQVVAQAAYAPSWKNTQISRYIAIEDRSVLDAICRDFLPEHNANIVSGAPLLIAQTFIKGRSGFERDGSYTTERKDGWQHYDCGIAAQTFCLAAHEHGVGTVILGIYDADKVAEMISLPEGERVTCLIACGYPEKAGNPPARHSIHDIVRYL